MPIRTFTTEDLPNIAQIALRAGRLAVHHPHVYWMMTYTSPHLCLLAEHDGSPVGYVSGLSPFLDAHTCFLWQVGVVPEARRRNLGTDLGVEFFRRALNAGSRRVIFTIEENNTPSVDLLRKVAGLCGSGGIMKRIGSTGDIGAGITPEIIYEVGL